MTAHAEVLRALRGRNRRKVGTETWLTLDDHNVARVTYRGTVVLAATDDGGVILSTGGWPSQTTMRRMNDYLPGGWHVNGSTMRNGSLGRKPRPWLVWGPGGSFDAVPFLDTGEDGPDDVHMNLYTGRAMWGSNTGHPCAMAAFNTVTGWRATAEDVAA